MLAFTNKEMSLFMSEVKQKKDPTKDDRMFGFGFDSSKAIYQTRGFREIRDMSQCLIENRLDEIRNSFTWKVWLNDDIYNINWLSIRYWKW